jgi:hypothetical protein
MKQYTLIIPALWLVCATIVPAQTPAPAPQMDPEAATILSQWSDHHRQVEAAVFQLTDTIDDVESDGRKIQYAHTRKITVIRPNKLRIETTGDLTNRILWKDGELITVLDLDTNAYAQLKDPGTIEQAVAMLEEEYGMGLPAADLLVEDVRKSLIEGAEAIDYIGLGLVGEERCHHLAFRQGLIDWQVWIATGDVPALRKMVITYKQQSGQPQYTMQVLSVGDASKIAENAFTAVIPEGAEKIEFHPPAIGQ